MVLLWTWPCWADGSPYVMAYSTTGRGIIAGYPTSQAREQEHSVLIPLTQSDPEYLHAQGQISQGRNGVMRHRVSTSLGWGWSWARTGIEGCKPIAL